MDFSPASNFISDTDAELRKLLDAQRQAFSSDRYPSVAQRQNRIDRLIELVLAEADALVEAMRLDFGHRSPFHSFLVDGPGITVIMKDNRSKLERWIRPERRSSGVLGLLGARARIEWQPLGVVGIIAPWNFPVSSALLPACQAFAAGNRVMVKLPEQAPRTSEHLRKAIAERFDAAEMIAVTGDAQMGAAFSRLAFDHLLFTGATSIGRHILRAAAENLVPVTLELGGKSPVVIATDADIALAAQRIAVGKMLNAGQICLAPDYVLVPSEHENQFVEHYRNAFHRMLPTLRENDDYTSIINERHLTRLQSYIDDARRHGARIMEINPANESLAGTRKIAPALVLNTTPQMKIRQEEIFGPLLPVISYSSMQEAIDHINAGPRPLGAYYFGADSDDRRRFLQQTHSGGVTLNDIMLHAGNDNLPFGGVGDSGFGSYHGFDGFRTLSHGRSIQEAAIFSLNSPFIPPHGKIMRKLMRYFSNRELVAVRKRMKQSS
jgi:coniferyl-aldehyde dehydrogenase